MSLSPLRYHHKVPRPREGKQSLSGGQGAPGSSEAAVGPEEKGKGLMGRWGQGPGMGMGMGRGGRAAVVNEKV